MRLGRNPEKKMVANNHEFLFSIPALEMAISIAKGGLWHFCPIFFEINVTLKSYEAMRGPKRTWPTMAIKCIHSILTLEAALNTASDGFWRFCS